MIGRMVYLCFGDTPRHKVGQQILVCSIDGCMAEQLNPVYNGVIVEKTRVKCHGTKEKDGKIAAVNVRVIDPMSTGGKAGEIKSELACRM